MHRKGALDTDAEADLADGERLAHARALATDHDTLEDLDARAGPLDDLDVDLQSVPGTEVRDVRALRGGVEGVQRLHRGLISRGATGHPRWWGAVVSVGGRSVEVRPPCGGGASRTAAT